MDINFKNICIRYDDSILSDENRKYQKKMKQIFTAVTIAAAILLMCTSLYAASRNRRLMENEALGTAAAVIFLILVIGVIFTGTLASAALADRIAYHGMKPGYTDFINWAHSISEAYLAPGDGTKIYIEYKTTQHDHVSLWYFLHHAGLTDERIQEIQHDIMQAQDPPALTVTFSGMDNVTATVQECPPYDPTERLLQALAGLKPSHLDGLPPIAAIDFDGVLADCVWPGTGHLNLPLIHGLKKLQDNTDLRLILYTCRTGKTLEDAARACEKEGLHFDAVNANIPEVLEAFGHIDSRKITADIYVDDKNHRYRYAYPREKGTAADDR